MPHSPSAPVVTQDDADGTLVSRFLERGDESAFIALYDRHTPRMFGLALRLAAGSEADACDLVQETWLRAVARLGGFRGDSRLSSWLCGICSNVWREWLRRGGRELALEAAPESMVPGSRAGRRSGRAGLLRRPDERRRAVGAVRCPGAGGVARVPASGRGKCPLGIPPLRGRALSARRPLDAGNRFAVHAVDRRGSRVR